MRAASGLPRHSGMRACLARRPGIQRLLIEIAGSRKERARNDGGTAPSALRHGDVDPADVALGADRDGLLVAARGQRQICGKAGGLDEHLDLAAARGALQVAENVAAALAPIPRDAVAI